MRSPRQLTVRAETLGKNAIHVQKANGIPAHRQCDLHLLRVFREACRKELSANGLVVALEFAVPNEDGPHRAFL